MTHFSFEITFSCNCCYCSECCAICCVYDRTLWLFENEYLFFCEPNCKLYLILQIPLIQSFNTPISPRRAMTLLKIFSFCTHTSVSIIHFTNIHTITTHISITKYSCMCKPKTFVPVENLFTFHGSGCSLKFRIFRTSRIRKVKIPEIHKLITSRYETTW